MNQILFNNIENDETSSSSDNKTTHKKTFFLKFQFIICSIIAVSVTAYYAYSLYENNKKENLSKKLLDNFNISTLYKDTNYTTAKTTNQNIYSSNGTDFSVIGLIEIKSIKINYPIISSFNNDLLKIAPCRFSGPMPNEVRKSMYCWP